MTWVLFSTVCAIILGCNLCSGSLMKINGTTVRNKSMSELVKCYGYPYEIHVDIMTDDGYLLTMQRIPSRIKNNSSTRIKKENKYPVLFMHGLMGAAEVWLINGPGQSLPFLLADLGYDVWLANARGTAQSRKHVTLDPDSDSKFWQFSWQEIGVYDIPALIDYIRKETKKDKVIYVGHSQGTTAYFVMGSERPKYDKYVKLMVALAPVVYVSKANDPTGKFLAQFEQEFDVVTSALGVNEYIPKNDLISLAGKSLCQNVALENDICSNMLFLMYGYDSRQINRTAIPLMMKYTPAGFSMKQLIHFAQLVNAGEFTKYDFGLIQNIVKYNDVFPPNFDLSKTKAPVALFYSKNDDMVSKTDIARLSKNLPNVVKQFLVSYEFFNHLDFIWAIDAKRMLYSHVIKLIEDY